MEKEGIVTEFYTRIQDSSNPSKDLTHFYCSVFGVAFNVDLLKAISRAVKMYGKMEVFKAIISIEGMEKINHSNIYPLLRFMCLKQLEAVKPQVYGSLVDYAKEMQRLADKAATTRWKVRDPFDE